MGKVDRSEIKSRLTVWASEGYDISPLTENLAKVEAEETAELQQDLREAQEALRRGSLGEAKALYCGILKRIPDHTDALKGLKVIERKEHVRTRLAQIKKLALRQALKWLRACGILVIYAPAGVLVAVIVGSVGAGIGSLLMLLFPSSPLWEVLKTFKFEFVHLILVVLYFVSLIFSCGATLGAVASIRGCENTDGIGKSLTFFTVIGSVIGFLTCILLYPVWPLGIVGVILGGFGGGLCWKGSW